MHIFHVLTFAEVKGSPKCLNSQNMLSIPTGIRNIHRLKCYSRAVQWFAHIKPFQY